MINLTINLIVSVMAYYLCKMLDKIYTYLKKLKKEDRCTYNMYLFLILYFSLIVFEIGSLTLIPVIYL
ncbi:hypothetical protein C827_04558 [Escherichia coli SWW33]|nr:hypothetical protein C827_04558 [Escherichia coli SWW33]